MLIELNVSSEEYRHEYSMVSVPKRSQQFIKGNNTLFHMSSYTSNMEKGCRIQQPIRNCNRKYNPLTVAPKSVTQLERQLTKMNKPL